MSTDHNLTRSRCISPAETKGMRANCSLCSEALTGDYILVCTVSGPESYCLECVRQMAKLAGLT